MSVADVQILSNASVSSGEGVYWMFYSGGSFEPVQLPAGLSQVLAGGGWVGVGGGGAWLWRLEAAAQGLLWQEVAVHASGNPAA